MLNSPDHTISYKDSVKTYTFYREDLPQHAIPSVLY